MEENKDITGEGVLFLTRTTGTIGYLFGSQVPHREAFTLTLSTGEEGERGYFYSRKTLAEVYITQKDLYGLLVGANCTKVPCTIRYYNEQQIKYAPKADRGDAFTKFKEDIQYNYKTAKDVAAKAIQEIDSLKISRKDKDSLRTFIRTLSETLTSNINFSAEELIALLENQEKEENGSNT